MLLKLCFLDLAGSAILPVRNVGFGRKSTLQKLKNPKSLELTVVLCNLAPWRETVVLHFLDPNSVCGTTVFSPAQVSRTDRC